MYMAGKLRVFEPRSRLWKLALVLLPLIGAYLITISRVCNYVHHWQDVLVGGVLGECAWATDAARKSAWARDGAWKSAWARDGEEYTGKGRGRDGKSARARDGARRCHGSLGHTHVPIARAPTPCWCPCPLFVSLPLVRVPAPAPPLFVSCPLVSARTTLADPGKTFGS